MKAIWEMRWIVLVCVLTLLLAEGSRRWHLAHGYAALIPASSIEWEAQESRGDFDVRCVAVDWYDKRPIRPPRDFVGRQIDNDTSGNIYAVMCPVTNVRRLGYVAASPDS